MAAAAGERLQSFDSALATTLQGLKLTFSLRKEQRTALKSFLKNKYVFVVLINYVVRAVALTTSPSLLLWLVVALSYCVQRELERQPFIPPTLPMEQCQTRHLSDVGLACQASPDHLHMCFTDPITNVAWVHLHMHLCVSEYSIHIRSPKTHVVAGLLLAHAT